MKVIIVKTKKEKLKFLNFRGKIYNRFPHFVDNNRFMIKQLFFKKTCFWEGKQIIPLSVEDEGAIKCQCVAIWAKGLPEYIQMCFFESEENCGKAVKMLFDKVVEIGKSYGCTKLVVGLNGHVNYGLGLLCDHYESKNSFGAAANPNYYNDYFKALNCAEIFLNTYKWNDMKSLNSKAKKYAGILSRVNATYRFETLDKKRFDYYAKIYTDLNNECFAGHRYYYKRTYEEDREMLRELLLFMKQDSLIFAFDGDKPVGFVLWYPDFNELVSQGESFGAKTYIKNLFSGKKIKTAKITEIGTLKECRKFGLLSLGLLYQVYLSLKKYGFEKGESSWILDENTDSNSISQGFCDEFYKRYVVYEKNI